jgi:hypothetical protein
MSLKEWNHIKSCAHCHSWLMVFVELARHANVEVAFPIPPLKELPPA